MRLLVTAPASVYCLVHHMMRDLHDGLVALGLDSVYVQQQASEASAEFVATAQDCIRSGEDWCMIDVNGRNTLHGVPADGRYRRLSFMTDAPFTLWDDITAMPAGDMMTYVDANHATFLDDAGVTRPRLFLPHAGPLPEAAPPAMAERDIPLLFVGNLTHPPGRDHLERLFSSATDPLVRRVFSDAADLCLAEGREPYVALKAACAVHGLAAAAVFPPAVLARLARELSLWVEAHRRRHLLTALGGAPVTVVGLRDPGFFGDDLPDLNFVGLATGEQVRALLSRSRVVINSVSVFPGGSHERIWYAMAAGAVVATDPSTLVERDFRFGEHLLSLADDLEDASRDLRRLDRMAAAARDVYLRTHTWHRRAEAVARALGLGETIP